MVVSLPTCPVPEQALHVLDKATKPAILSSLEMTWRTKHTHLDSRFNLLYLRADLHVLYNRFCFTLHPDPATLERIAKLDGSKSYREVFPFGENSTYQYQFVTLPTLHGTNIFRERKSIDLLGTLDGLKVADYIEA